MSAEVSNLWQFGEFRLDVQRKVLWHRDKSVPMPLKELEVLSVLVRNRGELVTKNELLDEIWEDAFVEESNLSRHIYLLRKMLRDLGAADGLIENVPRRGYRFSGEAVELEAGDVVLEKHTHTRTLIEIRDETFPGDTAAISRRRSMAYGALIVIFLGASAFLASQYINSKPVEPDIRSIAVLPFRTIGSSAERSSAGVGLADVLITRLNNIKSLKTRPTTAVIGLQDQDQDPVAIGEKLQVDTVLIGTLYYLNDKVRVTARLVKISDGSAIWTGEFEKLAKDELLLQNELAAQIVPALVLNLSKGEMDALAKRYTENADAYQLYVKGRHEWSKRTGPAMTEAERLFRNAIAADPEFALAYVGLADTMAMNFPRGHETFAAITRALELDPDLAEAHASLGFYLMFYRWEWNAAEAEFRRSSELKPGYATAHHWYATLLAIKGDTSAAIAEMQRALEIDPLAHNLLADLGQLYYFAGDYAEAEKYCRKSIEVSPDFAFAHQYLHYIYLKTGEYDNALEEIIKADKIVETLQNASPKQVEEFHAFEEAYRRSYARSGIDGYFEHRFGGSTQEARAYYFYAIKHARLGENEKALDYLERSAEARMFLTAFVKAEPIFERLRAEPRYREILRKMGLA